MCIATPTFDQLLRTVLNGRISQETWRFIDDCQRSVRIALPPSTDSEVEARRKRAAELEALWAAEDEARGAVPIRLVESPPPEAQKAWTDSAEIEGRGRTKIKELRSKSAPRRADCGHGRPLHIRKVDDRGAHDGLIRSKCGRSTCPYCWRLRLIKTIKRAIRPLVWEEGQPRVGSLYWRMINWEDWPSVNRWIRRNRGKKCGRLHLVRTDLQCLVVSEQSFPGAEETTIGDAVDRVLGLVENMHSKKSAFRLLGRWMDKPESEWKLIRRFGESFDLEPVKEHLDALGAKSQWGWQRVPEIQQGVVWHSTNEEAAEALWARLETSCHFLTPQKDISSKRPESDTRQPDSLPDEWTVPDQDHDPGGSQWS